MDDWLHLTNLAVHVIAGIVGIGLGVAILLRPKGTCWHRSRGRAFAWAVLVVTLTAAVGSIYFRFMPLFVVLTVLTTYQLVSGWRVVRRKDAGPAAIDAAWTAAAIGLGVALWPVFAAAPRGDGQQIVVVSTAGALAFVLAYDTLRWAFPRRWFARLWPYEHVYKLVATLAALVSAFAGNVIRFGQPWSQIAPSALGMLVIGWFWWRLKARRIRLMP